MNSGALRALLFVLFWSGVIGVVREWRYSRKHGLAITRAEKLYLVFALPVIFGLQLVLDLAGIPFAMNLLISFLAMCVALNAWPILRRVNRT